MTTTKQPIKTYIEEYEEDKEMGEVGQDESVTKNKNLDEADDNENEDTSNIKTRRT